MRDAIAIHELSKKFRRYRVDRSRTFQEAFLRGLPGMASPEWFWALRSVSFRVARGRMLGILGANGAGKSTLLRLIGGVGRPDRGRVQVHGRIGALLDLGTGFHPDLTGRENVFINGVISGLTRREVAQRFDDIVAFAELADFIDSPLRTYSTGMQMRLAFSVAAHIEPEILLIDEILAVGDLSFQRKCLDRITEFRAKGCTIILVSHDAGLVAQLCDEALWLRAGQIVAHGPAPAVADEYVADMTSETRRRTPAVLPSVRTAAGTELRAHENRFGSLEMEIVAVRLLNRSGLPATALQSGDSLQIEIEYLAPNAISSPILGVTISREDGLVCYDTSTEAAGLGLPTVQGQGRITLNLDRLDLMGGSYFVDVGIYEQEWAYAYDYHWHVYPLLVRSNVGEKGILHPPHHWKIEGVSAPNGRCQAQKPLENLSSRSAQ